MRVKAMANKEANYEEFALSGFPFAREREAVIAHEVAHLQQNHASGILVLNGLIATAALTFYFRPKFSLFPLALYAIATPLWHRHCELEADRVASLKMGPEVMQGLIHRLEAKVKLENMILAKYSLDDSPYRQVLFERVYNLFFHVPNKTRIAALKALAETEQMKQRKTSSTALSPYLHDEKTTTIRDKRMEALRRHERG